MLNEEDNIKHILASLLVGETNQSNIIRKLSSKNFINRTKRALFIKRLSPVAWTHINFYGQYEFLAENIIDIDGLLNQLKKKNFYLFEDQNN